MWRSDKNSATITRSQSGFGVLKDTENVTLWFLQLAVVIGSSIQTCTFKVKVAIAHYIVKILLQKIDSYYTMYDNWLNFWAA